MTKGPYRQIGENKTNISIGLSDYGERQRRHRSLSFIYVREQFVNKLKYVSSLIKEIKKYINQLFPGTTSDSRKLCLYN